MPEKEMKNKKSILKRVSLTLFFCLCLINIAYADSQYYAALEFAKSYANEIRARAESGNVAGEECEKTGDWKSQITINSGVAKYEESEQGVTSDWSALYNEIAADLTREGAADVETSLYLAYGRSLTDTETWYVSDVKYQTNDLDIYRINFRATLGKILYHNTIEDLRVIPFLGYGFRFIDFKRTNFNILDIITSRDVVTEKYYIHYLNVGIKLDKKLTAKWDISGAGLFGYAISNEADNSALGRIDGGGGYIYEGKLNLGYSLNDSWQLLFGGIGEWQQLRGGEKNTVIWPDNDFDVYTGSVAIRHTF